MKYMGLDPVKPKIGVFELTSCEGCQLQLLNKEETLTDFLGAVEIASFREASSAPPSGYDIALVDGAISRNDEVKKLQTIRKNARVVVALGSCACFGGVNQLKNAFNLEAANREVYGDDPKESLMVRPIRDIVTVDFEIPGCPVSKSEVEAFICCLVWDSPFTLPLYPVCVECKQRFTTCLFDMGQLCLGPITRAGCNAPCPAGGLGCYGCRGPAPQANFASFVHLVQARGFTDRELLEHMNFFGGFGETTPSCK
jgi:coenzyme F420-reducing hydrogenase gamma subunit